MKHRPRSGRALGRGFGGKSGVLCALLALFGVLLSSCARPAPPSRFPSAAAAIARMRETQACSRGVSAEGKIDYYGPGGRVRGSVLYLVAAPENVRLDVFSPFGATLSTLTSDGERFALYDLSKRSLIQGAANACNLERFTRVPLPPHAFVELLRGQAPVLVHEPTGAEIDWEGGSYVIRIKSRHRAEQEIRLLPPDADYALPWSRQRLRVIGTTVRQAGVELYRVELGGHAVVHTSAARVDPDGFEPPIPPSGPACDAELPRTFRFTVETADHDLVLSSTEAAHNPPLVPDVFRQRPFPGVRVQQSSCSDAR
jgi:hypothetical protein